MKTEYKRILNFVYEYVPTSRRKLARPRENGNINAHEKETRRKQADNL